MRVSTAPAFLCLLLLFANVLHADPPPDSRQQGSLRAEGTLTDGHPFAIAVEIAPLTATPGRPPHYYGSEAGGYRPRCVIQSFTLTLAGRTVVIPPEAYVDLGDPGFAVPAVTVTDKDQVAVTMHGGQDSGWGGYTVEWRLRRAKLVERRVTNVMSASVFGKDFKPDIKTFR